jgi:hypothetical protein
MKSLINHQIRGRPGTKHKSGRGALKSGLVDEIQVVAWA